MRTRTRLSIAIVATIAVLPVTGSHASSNLIENPDFEITPVPREVRQAAFNQGGFPTGWAVEGVTALFDHTPQNPHKGQYAAAISGSYSTPRKDCSVQCVEVPGGEQRDTAYGVFSVAPAWRTALPIAVSGGKQYRFSTWIRLAIPKEETGAVTHVRWFDANGVPLGRTNGPTLLAPKGGANYATFAGGTFKDYTTDWVYKVATVTAPPAARSAVIVLGYTDDAWIGQVVYDYVCFAQKTSSTTVCDTTYAQ